MDRGGRRPLSLLADARRRRPPPDRRGHPSIGCGTCSARTTAVTRASMAPPSRSGRRRARSVRVVGDFNSWDGRAHPMRMHGLVGGVGAVRARRRARPALQVRGRTARRATCALKADPLARAAELPPGAASIIATSRHQWDDAEWLERRERDDPVKRPLTIYEVHLGSWRQGLGYRELARAARRPRERPRLHACRAAAGGRAPVRRLVGLPSVELLRAHGALRVPRRLPLVRRPPAPSAASA